MRPWCHAVVAMALIALITAGCSPGTSQRSPSPAAGTVTATEVARPEPSAPLPSVAPAPTATRPVRAAFDADLATAFAVRLSTEVGPRPADGPREAEAREMLAVALRGAGWTVTEEPFPLPQGGTSANVVAWRDRDPRDAAHVVIGGHVDTVEGSPGANDNASGLGVLVALAEELADEHPGVPLVLVGFGAEEYQPSQPPRHHIGSEAYADEHGDQVVAALSVDMIGDGQTTCICWYGAGPDSLARRLGALAPGDGFEVRSAGDISDHGPFARRGVPAAMLWTGRNARWHAPGDTAEHLDVADVRRAGDLTLAFIRDLRPEETSGLAPGEAGGGGGTG